MPALQTAPNDEFDWPGAFETAVQLDRDVADALDVEAAVGTSGVPDGLYVIETVANPIRTVRETTYDDNVARATIRLRGDTVTRLGDGVRPSDS